VLVVVRVRADKALLVGRMLYDFNTEFETPTPSAEQFGARFERLLERDDVIVLVAGTDDGFAYLTLRPCPYYEGPLAQLEELYVRPSLRGKGIGTALIREAIRIVRENAGGEIQINVDEVDTDARRFYERHGFVNVEPGAEGRMLCYIQEL
jgi:ribosomal protein S18 acetylase RimI-like enzyme